LLKKEKNTDTKDIIAEVINAQFEKGTRSNYKIKVLHTFFSEILSKKLGKDFFIKSLNLDENKNGEYKYVGKCYSKNIDIAIFYKNKFIVAFETKFVMVHYNKNANNYLESMLGQATGLKKRQHSSFSFNDIKK